MSRKITNFFLILVILVALGLGFYFGSQKFTFFQSLFTRSEKTSLSTTGNESSDTVSNIENVSNEVVQPQPETRNISSEPVKPEIVPQQPVVPKLLTLSEIKDKIAVISNKVEILKIEVAKYLAEKQLQEMNYAEIQSQINDIAIKINALSKEITGLSMSGSGAIITITPIMIEDLQGY